VEFSDKLLCVFTAEITKTDDSYTIEVPKREVDIGSVNPSEFYRVALLPQQTSSETQSSPIEERDLSQPQPPVENGEIRYVEIEDIGKQGDGIARVERGYVIIVPESEMGERVKIEITEVKPNFAVGEIIEESFE
jgi:predicted RNA-binding protein with TRAM domain